MKYVLSYIHWNQVYITSNIPNPICITIYRVCINSNKLLNLKWPLITKITLRVINNYLCTMLPLKIINILDSICLRQHTHLSIINLNGTFDPKWLYKKIPKKWSDIYTLWNLMKNKITQTNICISSILIPSHGREFILLPPMTKIKSDHLVRLSKYYQSSKIPWFNSLYKHWINRKII